METLARFTAELYKFISITRCNYSLPDVQRNFVKNTGTTYSEVSNMRLQRKTHRIKNETKSNFLSKIIKVHKVDFKLKGFNDKNAKKTDTYVINQRKSGTRYINKLY